MKAIFLSDAKETLLNVYAPSIREKLSALVSLDGTVYGKQDVLSSPDTFSDIEIIFSTWGMPSFTEEEIARIFPRLSAIFYAAGTVQSFARPFLAKGVRIFSAWAANAVPVAEYTVAQIVLAGKGFFANTRKTKNPAGWCEMAAVRGEAYRGNYGARIGLIGCGMIGSLVAEMLKQYRFDVVAFDPFLTEERAQALGVTRVSLEELFASASVISNHLANNAQTQGMLNGALFETMRPYATFLNTGRGAQVVEADLASVLQSRADLTAVLDVTQTEPPVENHPFYSLENCFLTPHIAGSLGDEVVRMAEYMAKELSAYLENRASSYEVTAAMLATMA